MTSFNEKKNIVKHDLEMIYIWKCFIFLYIVTLNYSSEYEKSTHFIFDLKNDNYAKCVTLKWVILCNSYVIIWTVLRSKKFAIKN